MPNLFQRFRHWLDNPPGSSDMSRHGDRCPKCENRNADGAKSCWRCGHDMASPFRITAEQKQAAYLDGSCVSCRRRRSWRSGDWRDCGKCAAPHCRSCWELTAAVGLSATRWLCLHCRQWNPHP